MASFYINILHQLFFFWCISRGERQIGILGFLQFEIGISLCLKLGFWKLNHENGIWGFLRGNGDFSFISNVTWISLVLCILWIWDFTSFEIGILPHLKLGFWDLTLFEIGILGFQYPLLHTPISICWCQTKRENMKLDCKLQVCL